MIDRTGERLPGVLVLLRTSGVTVKGAVILPVVEGQVMIRLYHPLKTNIMQKKKQMTYSDGLNRGTGLDKPALFVLFCFLHTNELFMWKKLHDLN